MQMHELQVCLSHCVQYYGRAVDKQGKFSLPCFGCKSVVHKEAGGVHVLCHAFKRINVG